MFINCSYFPLGGLISRDMCVCAVETEANLNKFVPVVCGAEGLGALWWNKEQVSDVSEPTGCIRANALVLTLITIKHNTSVSLNALKMHPVEYNAKTMYRLVSKQKKTYSP